MFNSKQNNLFGDDKATSASAFVKAGMKESARTLSGNMAEKFSTTGNPFVDQFTSLGNYKVPRNPEDIFRDMSVLAARNLTLAVKFILYLRIITRVVNLFTGERTKTVQRGAGLRHESIMRMIWLHIYHPAVFYKNITLLILAGSWKDIIQMLSYDVQYNGWVHRKLDWQRIVQLIVAGLENPNTHNLVKKYLPQIKAKSKCSTLEAQADNVIAKYICNELFGNDIKHYKQYRKLKTSGTAHQWQQLISQRRFLEIDFDTVHGRALAQMVSGKFLTNQGLDKKYEEWLSTKPVAKFTGFVHELFQPYLYDCGLTLYFKYKFQEDTVNKQFAQLVETAKKDANTSTSMIVVRDTSGSMQAIAAGTTIQCGNLAKALALFFSKMLPEGPFANAWIEFNSEAQMHYWEGATPTEQWQNDKSGYVGNTNFQSVIDLFCEIRLDTSISEEQFPTGIICISDGEFDPADLYKTNVEAAREKLLKAGFSPEYVKNFKIVLWDLRNNYYGLRSSTKFETYEDVENVFYFSGYDGSIMAFLTGTEYQKSEPKTAEELFSAAMDQELLNMIQV